MYYMILFFLNNLHMHRKKIHSKMLTEVICRCCDFHFLHSFFYYLKVVLVVWTRMPVEM